MLACIPYPLIFGAVVDSTCLVWEEKCGKTGNCWIYDQDKFRYYLHGTALAFMCVGSLMDLGIIFNAKRIKNFYDESTDDNEEQETKNGDNTNIPLNSVPDLTGADPDDYSGYYINNEGKKEAQV